MISCYTSATLQEHGYLDRLYLVCLYSQRKTGRKLVMLRKFHFAFWPPSPPVCFEFFLCTVTWLTLCICHHSSPPSDFPPSLISNAQSGTRLSASQGNSCLDPVTACLLDPSIIIAAVFCGFGFFFLFRIISRPSPSQLVPFASSKANSMPAFIFWHGLGRDMSFLINPRQASRLLPIRLQLLPSWSQSLSFSLPFGSSFYSSTALISWAVETPWALKAYCPVVGPSFPMNGLVNGPSSLCCATPLSSLLALSL